MDARQAAEARARRKSKPDQEILALQRQTMNTVAGKVDGIDETTKDTNRMTKKQIARARATKKQIARARASRKLAAKAFVSETTVALDRLQELHDQMMTSVASKVKGIDETTKAKADTGADTKLLEQMKQMNMFLQMKQMKQMMQDTKLLELNTELANLKQELAAAHGKIEQQRRQFLSFTERNKEMATSLAVETSDEKNIITTNLLQTMFEIMRSEQCLKCEAKTLKLLENTILSPAADQQAPAAHSRIQELKSSHNAAAPSRKKGRGLSARAANR